MSRINVLYIAGYSRCGSTALSMALDQHEDIFNVGELAFLGEDFGAAHRTCSCQASYADCPFWGTMPEALRTRLAAPAYRKLENRRGSLSNIADAQAYGTVMSDLMEWVRETSGKSIILDVSKSARGTVARARALHQLAGQRVGILHLVRDPRSTVRSYIENGSNWAQEGHKKASVLPGLRAAVGWALANHAAEGLSGLVPDMPYLCVRYEDLVANPETEMQRISGAFELDLSTVMEAIKAQVALDGGHSVGGNRTRYAARPFDLTPKDSAVALPLHHQLVLNILAGDLIKKYGYTD